MRSYWPSPWKQYPWHPTSFRPGDTDHKDRSCVEDDWSKRKQKQQRQHTYNIAVHTCKTILNFSVFHLVCSRFIRNAVSINCALVENLFFWKTEALCSLSPVISLQVFSYPFTTRGIVGISKECICQCYVIMMPSDFLYVLEQWVVLLS